MSQKTPAIREDRTAIGGSDQLTMRWQGRQGLGQPDQPLLKLRVNREAPSELLNQERAGLERKLPESSLRAVLACRSHRAQLGLGDRIKGCMDLDPC
jgi:hypothetical protein